MNKKPLTIDGHIVNFDGRIFSLKDVITLSRRTIGSAWIHLKDTDGLTEIGYIEEDQFLQIMKARESL